MQDDEDREYWARQLKENPEIFEEAPTFKKLALKWSGHYRRKCLCSFGFDIC
jgi:hypothetical protein